MTITIDQGQYTEDVITNEPYTATCLYNEKDELERVEWSYGATEYYKNNSLERIEWTDGTVEHYKNNVLHNGNGPARKWADGTKEYFFEGLLHNTRGPAIISPGNKNRYFLHGVEISEQEFKNSKHK